MLRLQSVAAIAIVALSPALGSLSAYGQDEPQFIGSVEVVRTTATKVRKLGTQFGVDFDGVRGVFAAPKGKAFLVLHLELKPTFAKNADGDEVSYAFPEAVSLKVEQNEPAWSIGTCDPHGRFQAYASGYSFYASDEPQAAGYDPVFVIPEGATTATLTLGGNSYPVKIPADVVDAIDPAQAIQLQVDAARTVTELRRRQELGTFEHEEGEFVQQIVTTAGRYALVSIVLKPKVRNQPMGFSANLTEFGLLLGKEVYVAPVGAFENDEFNDYASEFFFEQDALGEFNAGKATLVFPLPGAVTSGKLLYLGAPVADVTFGK